MTRIVLICGHTSRILTFDHQSQMSHDHDPYTCKMSRSEFSRLKKIRMETDGWIEGANCIIRSANVVGNKTVCVLHV